MSVAVYMEVRVCTQEHPKNQIPKLIHILYVCCLHVAVAWSSSRGVVAL